jgi:DNA-binding MarR family transcriptional regulator
MSAVTSVLRVNQLLSQRADAILAPIDLTFARYEVLVVLYFNTDGVPLSFLADVLKLHQASITNLVDKLEKQGYLERVKHPSDRRSTLARATRAGRARVRMAIKRLNAELFSQLGLTEADLRTLTDILGKLRGASGDAPVALEPGKEGGDASRADLPVAQSSA